MNQKEAFEIVIRAMKDKIQELENEVKNEPEGLTRKRLLNTVVAYEDYLQDVESSLK